MLWRMAVLSIVAVMISGCATARNGADFASTSQKLGPTKPGQARIVVFREQAFGLIDPGLDVKLDGQPMDVGLMCQGVDEALSVAAEIPTVVVVA